MNTLASLRDYVADIELLIEHKSLSIRPAYYDQILDNIMQYEELPGLLRRQSVLQQDESVLSFICIVHEYWTVAEDASVAVLCSGCGALTRAFADSIDCSRLTFHHFDASRNMLGSNSFAHQQHLTDLSENLPGDTKVGLVFSMGCLRYFSNEITVFCKNVTSLMTKNTFAILAEVDRKLVVDSSANLRSQGLTTEIVTRHARVFRNTLFYFLLERYRNDDVFKHNVDTQAAEFGDYGEVLITLAGFKDTDYHYCVGRISS